MSDTNAMVIVVDHDPSFRRSAERLIRLAGFQVQTFSTAAEFLRRNRQRPDGPVCLVLDVRMPELSGLDLQRELAKAGVEIPIIFVTGHGNIRMSVQAMKAGAVDFLTKPCCEQDLLGAIQQAIQRDRARRDEQTKLAEIRARYACLTRREREVMAHVASGSLNKQIAAELGTTEKTVKFHRGHVMRKMQVHSVPDLVRMAASLDKSP